MVTNNEKIMVASVGMKTAAGTEETMNLKTSESSVVCPSDQFTSALNSDSIETLAYEIERILDRVLEKAGNMGKQIGLVVASNFYECFAQEEKFNRYEFQFQTSMLNQICEKYGFSYMLNNSTACSSGGNAIITACQLIRMSMVDSVIVLGYEVKNHYSLSGMKRIGALTKDKIRPFSSNRDGTVLGDGIGVIALKPESLCDGDEKIEVAGFGLHADGYNITSPNPDGESLYQAMEDAIEMAGIEKEKVRYINAHGSGTKMNDSMETEVIKRVFGEHTSKLYINSTKSLIGHVLGASEIVEFVITVLQMKKNCIHITANYDSYDEACDLCYCTDRFKEIFIPYAMTNSIGFGGINVSILLKNGKEETSKMKDKVVLAAVSNIFQSKDELDFYQKGFKYKAYLDKSSQLCMCSTAEVISGDVSERKRSLITISQNGCPESCKNYFGQLTHIEEYKYASPLLFTHSLCNIPNSLTTIEFGIKGAANHYVGSADATLFAFQQAEFYIRQMNQEEVIVTAFESNSDKSNDYTLNRKKKMCLSQNEGSGSIRFTTEQKVKELGQTCLFEFQGVVVTERDRLSEILNNVSYIITDSKEQAEQLQKPYYLMPGDVKSVSPIIGLLHLQKECSSLVELRESDEVAIVITKTDSAKAVTAKFKIM